MKKNRWEEDCAAISYYYNRQDKLKFLKSLSNKKLKEVNYIGFTSPEETNKLEKLNDDLHNYEYQIDEINKQLYLDTNGYVKNMWEFTPYGLREIRLRYKRGKLEHLKTYIKCKNEFEAINKYFKLRGLNVRNNTMVNENEMYDYSAVEHKPDWWRDYYSWLKEHSSAS